MAMKGVTFAVAFILTACFVISGIILFPNILGQAATSNNDFVFELFLGPFVVLLFLAWVGEKVALKVWKKKE
jgi:hypothetical protein